MSKNPEPAVGQVWLTSLVTLHIEVIMQVGPLFLRTSNHYAVEPETVKKMWIYLGTLDELRARATAVGVAREYKPGQTWSYGNHLYLVHQQPFEHKSGQMCIWGTVIECPDPEHEGFVSWPLVMTIEDANKHLGEMLHTFTKQERE